MWCCHLLDFWKVWYVTTMIFFSKVPGLYRRKEERKVNCLLGCGGRMCQQVEGGHSSLCSALVKPYLDYSVSSGLPCARKIQTYCSESYKSPWGWLRTWRIWHTRRGWDSLEKARCPLVAVSVRMGVNKVGCSNFPNKPKIQISYIGIWDPVKKPKGLSALSGNSALQNASKEVISLLCTDPLT